MNEFLNNFFALSWWLSVVFVGLVLNLASAYLKSPLDSIFSKLSSWYAAHSQREREHEKGLVEWIKEDKFNQILMSALENRCLLMSLIYLVCSLILLVMSLTILSDMFWHTAEIVFRNKLIIFILFGSCLIFSMLSFFVSIRKFSHAIKLGRMHSKALEEISRNIREQINH